MFSITYGTGGIKGQLIMDTILLGDLEIKDQTFGIVSEEEGDAFLGVFIRKQSIPNEFIDHRLLSRVFWV